MTGKRLEKCCILSLQYLFLCLCLPFFWSPSITDDNVFLFIVECEFFCGGGAQCMSNIVCHKVEIGEQNLEVGGALRHVGVCV